MRQVIKTTVAIGVCLAAWAVLSQLVANSRFLVRSAQVLRALSHSLPAPSPGGIADLRHRVLTRAAFYDDLIVRSHLLDGMVVNLTLAGAPLDVCDSLLFSSLRYVGLEKLGLHDRARAAWSGIRAAVQNGQLVRHPRCHDPVSRDMLLGLTAALSQSPEGAPSILGQLLRRIDAGRGYLSKGPVYISYVTPGVARLLARLAIANGLSRADVPARFLEGYSTHELGAAVLDQGYVAHLHGLTLWLETELGRRHPAAGPANNGWPDFVPWLSARLSSADPDHHRLDWSALKLLETDHRNLFFRYLRQRTAHAMSPAVTYRMLDELMSMPQFPSIRLPADCDRKADYLWQRASDESEPASLACTRIYSGVDFLWMAGLLFDELAGGEAAPTSH